jgi:DoxX-like family
MNIINYQMKTLRILYWIVTGLLCLLMVFAAFNYIFKHELIVDVFRKLGFPTYIIYPLAAAKMLGVAAILTKRSKRLKEWAYAGFFFNFLLALSAHINANDGINALPAAICLVLLIGSYTIDRRIYG